MPRPTLLFGAVLLLAVPAAAQPAAAQGDAAQGRFGRAELTESNAGTYYRYFIPGEATVPTPTS